MKQRIIVLSADRYNITDDNGKTNKGTTMFYFSAPNLAQIVNEGESIGQKPVKESMPYEFFEEIAQVGAPVLAEVDYVMRVSNGKQVLKIAEIEFLPDDISAFAVPVK